jgi:DNA-binding MarR family transcriptional regulator
MTAMSDQAIERDVMQIYEFIRDFIDENEFAPSLRDIASGCYMAQSTVTYRLAKLEAKGWIVREFGIARSIRLGEYAPDARAPAE